MSDEIRFEGMLLGNIHYFVYKEGKRPGRTRDLFLSLNDLGSLETILSLMPGMMLNVGDEDISYETFREKYLTKVRDIHIQNNSLGTEVYG